VAQKGFYYDMTACIACKACQVACKDKNDLPVGITYRQVETFEGGSYQFHLLSLEHLILS
jgi:anaerobic dimethyl sulfoxide reductase subunit B (iron-sulfur subunit)